MHSLLAHSQAWSWTIKRWSCNEPTEDKVVPINARQKINWASAFQIPCIWPFDMRLFVGPVCSESFFSFLFFPLLLLFLQDSVLGGCHFILETCEILWNWSLQMPILCQIPLGAHLCLQVTSSLFGAPSMFSLYPDYTNIFLPLFFQIWAFIPLLGVIPRQMNVIYGENQGSISSVPICLEGVKDFALFFSHFFTLLQTYQSLLFIANMVETE